jgi:hypothetical protein
MRDATLPYAAALFDAISAPWCHAIRYAPDAADVLIRHIIRQRRWCRHAASFRAAATLWLFRYAAAIFRERFDDFSLMPRLLSAPLPHAAAAGLRC